MKNGNILVIEPNNGLLTSLVILLKKHFDKVSASNTVQEAEGLLATNLFDVILMDLDLFRIRSDAAGKVAELIDSGRGAEMVLLSTFAQVPTASECMEKGAFDFVHKPWNVTEIVTSLNNAIVKKRLLGRIKELENTLEKVVSESKIEQEHSQKAPNYCINPPSSYKSVDPASGYNNIGADGIYSVAEAETLEQIERRIIARVLARNRGNMSLTALQLGITRQTLYNKMRKQ